MNYNNLSFKETRPEVYNIIFSIYMSEFFKVPVGDSKGTKTSNFPLTSIPLIGIKTLGGKLTHPSRGQELKSQSNH